MGPARALEFARRNRLRFVDELKHFLRFPSISSQARHAKDVAVCADWLADHLQRIGLLRVKLIRSPGHPIVYADWMGVPGAPIVLIYGHYDVVPAEPLKEWISPPFTPNIRANDLYGRGACDAKGQLFVHLKAPESYLRDERALSVHVKCIFEGEEEIASPNLAPFLLRNLRALHSAVAVISDTKMLGPGRPAISYSQRGVLSMELEVRGPQKDLHSGSFGGAIHNPIQAICEIIARLHDDQRRVAVPGFYARVRPANREERKNMARTGPCDKNVLNTAGVEQSWGEPGYSLYERTTLRPALTINGITGGYQGPGGKGIIPARAQAKLSFRLVPGQDPREIERLVEKHIAAITPPTVISHLRTLGTARPVIVNFNGPFHRIARAAYQSGFGATPVFVRSGGTIPIVSTLHDVFRIPTVLMGFALPDDHIHAPNEKLHLPNFHAGIRTSISFLARVGCMGRRNVCERQFELSL